MKIPSIKGRGSDCVINDQQRRFDQVQRSWSLVTEKKLLGIQQGPGDILYRNPTRFRFQVLQHLFAELCGESLIREHYLSLYRPRQRKTMREHYPLSADNLPARIRFAQQAHESREAGEFSSEEMACRLASVRRGWQVGENNSVSLARGRHVRNRGLIQTQDNRSS